MKKLLAIVVVIGILLAMAGCTKTVHCDNCGKEIVVEKGSKMEEEWVVYCETCNEILFSKSPASDND